MIDWLSIVYVIMSMLSWPIATYIAVRKILSWKTTTCVSAAVSMCFVSIVGGFLLTDFIRFHFRGVGASQIGALFPLFWMVIPFLALLGVYLSRRMKDGRLDR